MGPIGCPETSAEIATTRCVVTQKKAFPIYFAAEAWNHAREVINSLLFLLQFLQLIIKPWKYESFLRHWRHSDIDCVADHF